MARNHRPAKANRTGQGDSPQRIRDDRGAMLLVSLGVLTLLSVLALAFVQRMSLEFKATRNYVDGVKARLIAEGALERALDEKRKEVTTSLVSSLVDDPASASVYCGGKFWMPIEDTSDVMNILNDPYRASVVGIMGQSYTKGADRFKIKIIDTQTQFNLNQGHNDTVFRLMLQSLGVGISLQIDAMNREITASAKRRGATDFAERLFSTGDPILRAEYPRLTPEQKKNGSVKVFRGADAIMELRKSREASRFSSKSELLQCLSEQDYRLVRDFVTTKSWFDPRAVEGRGSAFSSSVPRGNFLGGVVDKFREGTSERPEPMRRAPINLNQATKPVLYSALAPLAGRRVYTDSRVDKVAPVDAGSSYVIAKHEEVIFVKGHTKDNAVVPAGYGARNYLVYLPPLGYQQNGSKISFKSNCVSIINEIDAWRRSTDAAKGPFRSFQDWDRFVEERLYQYLPTATDKSYQPRIVKILKSNTGTGSGGVQLLNYNDPVYLDIVKDPRFQRWFQRSYAGMLKSNFNPNGRLSQMNPDSTVFVEVDKGNLFYLKGQLDGLSTTMNKDLAEYESQSMEWSFGSKGVFEIISLGEIVTNLPEDLLKHYENPVTAVNPAGSKDVEIHAQAKMRSVIQIYDQITHTSQRDFLANGYKNLGKAPWNQGIYGYPEEDGEPDAPRSNVKSYPVDDRRWMPDDTPAASFPQIPAAEFGGVMGREASDIADGYLQLRPVYFTKGDADDGVLPPYSVAFGSKTLFELRMDYRRSPKTLQAKIVDPAGGTPEPAPYSPAQTAATVPDRVALVIPDRAGNKGLSKNPATLKLFPGDDPTWPGVYRIGLTTPFAAPMPPVPLSLGLLGKRWLSTNGGSDYPSRWLRDYIYPDGYYAGEYRRPILNRLMFLKFRSYFQETGPVMGTNDIKALRGTTKPWSASKATRNLDPNRGAITFWYKPDFDWFNNRIVSPTQQTSNRFCGFFSSTHVAEAEVDPPKAGAPRGKTFRGTQMFMMRTTTGALRVTRLYYELAGADGTKSGDNQEAPYVVDPWTNQLISVQAYKGQVEKYFGELSKIIKAGDLSKITPNNPKYYPWPPRELFPSAKRGEAEHKMMAKMKCARYDTWVPKLVVPKLKAGRWYHFSVAWNDNSTDARSRCKIYLDGQPLSSQSFERGQPTYQAYDWDKNGTFTAPTVEAPAAGSGSTQVAIKHPDRSPKPNFVRLNGIVDARKQGGIRDEFSIGGFNRWQKKRAGVFKHERNASLPANGTVDNFLIWDTPDNSTVQSRSSKSLQRYFEEGTWTQRFDLKDLFGASKQPLRILGASFTAYLPHSYNHDLNPGATEPKMVFDSGASVEVELFVKDPSKQFVVGDYAPTAAAARRQNWAANPSGRIPPGEIPFLKGPFEITKDDALVYRIAMTSGAQRRKNGGTISDISSPVFDAITVVYELPKRRILLKERVLD